MLLVLPNEHNYSYGESVASKENYKNIILITSKMSMLNSYITRSELIV